MKKYTVVGVCCLMLLLMTTAVHAQQGGFTGPMGFTGQQQAGFVGQPAGFAGQHGFWGPTMSITVAQVAQTFPNKAPAVLRGQIVQHLGSDRYLFRDSTGDIIIKIKHNRWWGLSVGPNDLVEIGGELKREKNGWIKYFDGKTIRMAL